MKITDVRRARIALDPTASPMLSILCAAAATHEQYSIMAYCFLVKRGLSSHTDVDQVTHHRWIPGA